MGRRAHPFPWSSLRRWRRTWETPSPRTGRRSRGTRAVRRARLELDREVCREGRCFVARMRVACQCHRRLSGGAPFDVDARKRDERAWEGRVERGPRSTKRSASACEQSTRPGQNRSWTWAKSRSAAYLVGQNAGGRGFAKARASPAQARSREESYRAADGPGLLTCPMQREPHTMKETQRETAHQGGVER